MVDVSQKPATDRTAIASSRVKMSKAAVDAIAAGTVGKGDVVGIARLAGIMAAKQTPTLIPLCHSLAMDAVSIEFNWEDGALLITAITRTSGKTGVEMEAMTAASVAALTVYDMVKSVDRWIQIGPTQLIEKSGGKSGRVHRDEAES